ncbi:MAG: LysM peptidoglycan-binding domain-containing protein [Candidatus Faecivicinus sp.]
MTESMPTRTTELLPPLGEASIQGVTVREADGTIDFPQLREDGFTAVYLRATAGDDYVDCRLNTNSRAVAAAGMQLGYLHYLTARTVDDAKQQAGLFLATIDGRSAELRPAMTFDRFRGLDVRTINAIAEAFLSAVEEVTGVVPMLRTDAESANQIWSPSLAEQYPLWVVDPDVAAPRVSTGKWEGWTGWEYGELSGVNPLPLSLFTPNVRPSAQSTEATKLICVTVAYGDTLTAIARLFETTVAEIVKLNAIANPNRIYPGQTLYIRVPVSTPVACCDTYTVRRGDTLSGIAARFGTTVSRLVAINQIADEDLITIGQVLTLGLCGTE